jgi:hypothetical protein
MSKNLNNAQPITLSEANGMITEYHALDKMVLKSIAKVNDEELAKRLTEFSGRNYNAFLFEKDSILRFFKEEPSEYLMIILGAHPETKRGFNAGSFTVIAAGVNRNAEEENTFYVVKRGEEKPATEYPPQELIAELKTDKIGQPELKLTLKG